MGQLRLDSDLLDNWINVLCEQHTQRTSPGVAFDIRRGPKGRAALRAGVWQDGARFEPHGVAALLMVVLPGSRVRAHPVALGVPPKRGALKAALGLQILRDAEELATLLQFAVALLHPEAHKLRYFKAQPRGLPGEHTVVAFCSSAAAAEYISAAEADKTGEKFESVTRDEAAQLMRALDPTAQHESRFVHNTYCGGPGRALMAAYNRSKQALNLARTHARQRYGGSAHWASFMVEPVLLG